MHQFGPLGRRIALIIIIPTILSLLGVITTFSLQAQQATTANTADAGTTLYFPLIANTTKSTNPGTDPGTDPDDPGADPDAPVGSFLEKFSGTPTTPTPWDPDNWDVLVHVRHDESKLYVGEPMLADHGTDCSSPSVGGSHMTSGKYEDTVFICRDHMMTAIRDSGYSAVYMTPNVLVDFTNETAIIRLDMSTMRTSNRDWWDIWITPFDQNLTAPLVLTVDLTGPPQNAIHFEMDAVNDAFAAFVYDDFKSTRYGTEYFGMQDDYRSFLQADRARRDVFEVHISKNHIKMGMPAYNFWWVDEDMPTLDWTKGIVQFGHHSYNPAEDKCLRTTVDGQHDICEPGTWHWDNVFIEPAVEFTMIHADRRYVDPASWERDNTTVHLGTSPVTFDKPAPKNAYMRFMAVGEDIEMSFDNGKTWVAAVEQVQSEDYLKDEHFRSFWTPVPEGTQRVLFRAHNWWGGKWHVRNMSIWALKN